MLIIIISIFFIINGQITPWIIEEKFDYEDDEIIDMSTNDDDNEDDEETENLEFTATDYKETDRKNRDGLFFGNAEKISKQNLRKSTRKNRITKRETEINDNNEEQLRIKTNKSDQVVVEYNYADFKVEYDNNLQEAIKQAAKLNKTEFEESKYKCDVDGFFDVGIKSLKCLKTLYSKGTPLQDIRRKFFRILLFWTTLFLIIYSFCFSYLGYLRCCCPWRICFPEDIEEEVKNYLVLNPPGVRIERGKKIKYKATETEIYLYNKLWNNIYRD